MARTDRFCHDCVHFHPAVKDERDANDTRLRMPGPLCGRLREFNPVTGQQIKFVPAERERQETWLDAFLSRPRCGERGRYFEKKRK